MDGKQRVKLIEHHKQQAAMEYVRFRKFRAWYEGRFWDHENRRERDLGSEDMRGAEFETPNTYAYIQTMIANIVPGNPQVTVRALRGGTEEARRAREALANDALVMDQAHDRLWRSCTVTSLDGVGFLKAMWSQREGRPTWRVLTRQNVWFDETAERWQDARYFIERVVLTRREFEERTKTRRNPAGGRPRRPLYDPAVAARATFEQGATPGDLYAVNEDDPTRHVFQTVVVYEFYDFEDDRFLHMLDGVEQPLLESELPYKKLRNPFIPMVFNDNTRTLRGISDIQLIESAQEVLNSLNAEEVRHAQASIPVMLIDGASVEEPDQFAKQLSKVRSAGEGIVVQRSAGNPVPLRDLLAYTPMPTLTPSWAAMKAEAKMTISYTLAIADYQRGAVGNSDIATELALADTSIRTLNGRRQKVVYDIIRWMGESAIALWEQFWPENEVIDVTVEDQELELTKDQLGFGEESPAYRFKAIPYSSAENSRVVQARAMVESLPVIQWGQALGVVDARKWFREYIDVNQLPNVLTPPGTMPLGAGPMPPQAPAPQPSGDIIATGALPPTTAVPEQVAPTGPRVVL